MAQIGFIGLGNMGLPMASNLADAGHDVVGYDIVAANIDAAVARGVRAAGSEIEAATGSDVVITMLPSGQHTLAVYQGSGALQAASKGTLFIDCSTIDVASARAAHTSAADAGMLSLDCPVSGGVSGAEAATLTLMAGGSSAAYDAGHQLLRAVAKKVVHCGSDGAGQAAKICNNMILGISMIGVCEAFVLAEKLGLSHQALYDVASTASGQCWSLTTYCPVPDMVESSPANNDFKPGFAATLMLKDLRLAQEAASANGAQTPLGAHASEIYEQFFDAGNGDVDFSGIIQAIRLASKA